MKKEEFKNKMKSFNEDIKIINDKKTMLILEYIELNKPCNIGDNVSIVLRSGRVAKGEVVSFGILKSDAENDVYITSYKDLKDNKRKYITVPTQSVTLI